MKIFCDYQFSPSAQALLAQEAETHRHELIFAQSLSTTNLVAGATDPRIAEAEIAVGQPDPMAIVTAENLRWVHLTSAGYTRYDTAEFRTAATTKGVVLTNSSGVYAEACAEHAFSFMLAQARQLPVALRTRTPSGTPLYAQLRNSCSLLRGQRVVILGYGAIAAHLAAMLEPFRCAVVAVRRTRRGDEPVTIVTPDQMVSELSVADHVVNILPENADSRGFVSAQLLAQMKKGAIFYNIGRGATVDQEALAQSLQNGQLEAAWLDVTTPEPLPEDHILCKLPNCYITPHTAGGQRNESDALVGHFLDNLRRYTAGAPLHDRFV